MIHVIDDSKNQKKDFTFSRNLLVKYMKYFDRCLKKISDSDEIDISIHCDAQIFEWLLNYIYAMEEYEKKLSTEEKQKNWNLKAAKPTEDSKQEATGFANSAIMKYGGPKLDVKIVVTILIPAEFLKIDRLVKECLDYIGEHIEEITRVNVDMSCINTAIIRELAKKVSLDRLDSLKERRDKIISKLFMKKLELMLEKEKNVLHKCAYCNKLFTKKQRKVLTCRNGQQSIDANGQMRAKHVIDRNWDFKKFVTYVRETYRISWKEIYWKVWSYLNLIRCDKCQEYYPIAEMGNCRFHPEPPKVKADGGIGSSAGIYEYKCCGETSDIYKVLNGCKGDTGCETQLHGTSYIYSVPAAKEQKIIDRIINHQLIIIDNPSNQIIEKLALQGDFAESVDASPADGDKAENKEQPHIVRPSSLNYKISLTAAVKAFIQVGRGAEQAIEVEPEEPVNKNRINFDVLDDALFSVTKNSVLAAI